jgi:hypothetical protein
MSGFKQRESATKVPLFVTPVKTGGQKSLNSLDTGFRRFGGRDAI